MRLPVVLAAAALGSLAAPGVAGAATWSAPQNLSSAHQFVDDPGLVVSQDGRALASWRFQDAIGDASRTGASSASRPPGAGAFERPRALVPRTGADRRAETVEGLAAYGRSRALLASTRIVGTAVARRIRLEVRFGRTDGRFGDRITIRRAGRTARTASRIAGVDLAVNASGDAAVAWYEDRGVRTDRVYVSLRRAGGRFGAPRRLATGRIRGVAVAVGASGDVLVAWDARGVLRTRFKPRARRGFRAADTIRSEDAFFADMQPVVTPNGRAVLAWSAQLVGEGGESGELYYQAAVRPSGAGRFRRAKVLEQLGREQRDRPIDAVVDSTGRVVVAWSGLDGATRRVRAAADDPSGGFGPAQDVSAPGEDALLSGLAAGPGGRLIAVWDGGVEDPASSVRAAVAPAAGEPFGPPESVSPAGQEARFGRAAFDPASGRATIVFSNRPEGSGRPVSEIETFAQAATRSE